MHDFVEWRVKEEANYMIETNSTIRAIAREFCVSKSTAYIDLTERLKDVAPHLYVKVNEILQDNKAERHLRGGNATKEKYSKLIACRTGSASIAGVTNCQC